MSNLVRRVRKLEAASRDREAQPCRWCSGIWIYPDDFPPVHGVQPPEPACEAPGTCPGGGLLIVLSSNEEAAGVCA